MRLNKNYIVAFLFILAIEVLSALYVHDELIRPYVGDSLVIVLLYCLIKSFIPNEIALLPLYIFIFAVIVEVGQYFHMMRILHLENNMVARIVIGTTFDIKDIISYLTGCVILFLWQKRSILR